MRIEKCTFVPHAYKVHVDSDELQCAARKLPYPTCVGVVYVGGKKRGKISVWTPAASKPRGYRDAAITALHFAYAQLASEGRVEPC
jgi:hypothetical protein